jgi:hypothetical protein
MQTTTQTTGRRIIDLGYRPREQFIDFHRRRERWSCLVAHRRAGKTVACVMDLIHRALKCEAKDGRFAYIAPYWVQSKDVAWLYVKRFTAPIPGVRLNESELYVEFEHNKARVRLAGADNYDRLRGAYLDGVILDEYGDMHPAAWPEVIRPMLSDRKGWATFIGTPKGRNDFHSKWEESNTTPGWFALMLRGSESGLLDDEELADLRRALTPEQYEQEIECNFNAAVLGAYYGKEIVEAERSQRIVDIAIERNLPVHTAWDLGIGDSTAIWCFQIVGKELRMVDHIESHGQPLSYYAGELKARGYHGDDWVPHDAKVRELSTGRTRVETLQQLSRKPRLVPNHKIEDGINAARVSFPTIWFDAVRCRQGIEALRQYRTEFDEKAKVFKSAPKHDWTSHSADAFRYASMAWKEIRPKPVDTKPKAHEFEVKDGVLQSNMTVREIIELNRRKRAQYD